MFLFWWFLRSVVFGMFPDIVGTDAELEHVHDVLAAFVASCQLLGSWRGPFVADDFKASLRLRFDVDDAETSSFCGESVRNDNGWMFSRGAGQTSVHNGPLSDGP